MKCCLQRVLSASVSVEDKIVGTIDRGILLFLGIEKDDDKKDLVWMRDKIINLRLFGNEGKKFDKSLMDIEGSILIVSQFTLAGNCNKGRRPDFSNSMIPDKANEFYDEFIKITIDILGISKVAHGVFGADMKIFLVNDGPVTFVLNK